MDIIPIMVTSGLGLILLFSTILFLFMTLGSVDDLKLYPTCFLCFDLSRSKSEGHSLALIPSISVKCL